MGDKQLAYPLRGMCLLLFLAILALSLACPRPVAAAEAWTGQWKLTVNVDTGANAGASLVCDGNFTGDGTTFKGTVTCPGFAPVAIYGEGTDQPSGLLTSGGYFSGSRNGNAASGTWHLPNQASSGRWSLTRAGTP